MSEERNEQAQYWDDVKGIAADVKEEIDNGNLSDWDSVADYLHESVDGSQRVIYTWKAKMAVIYSDNEDAYFEETGESGGAIQDGSINWSLLAFYAVMADVRELMNSDGIDEDYVTKLSESRDLIAKMDRSGLVRVLESISIECQNSESDDVLRGAIMSNVKDGTLDVGDIESATGDDDEE